MQASSFIRPEILSLPKAKLASYLKARELEVYRFGLEKLVRQKNHVLSESEERLLALQVESGQTANQTFEQLINADLKFGSLRDHQGREFELTHGSFRMFLESPERSV